MIVTLFYVFLPIYVAFCLWLGFRIVAKAGFPGWWMIVLLVPFVNIVMIWVFGFIDWPVLQANSQKNV